MSLALRAFFLSFALKNVLIPAILPRFPQHYEHSRALRLARPLLLRFGFFAQRSNWIIDTSNLFSDMRNDSLAADVIDQLFIDYDFPRLP